MNPQSIDANKRVQQYVALRDEIKRLDDEHKERMRPYRETLEKLNGVLLDILNKMGGDKPSFASEYGTAYVSHKKSVTLTDPAAFMKYVIENQAYDLLDRKANVKAVEDYLNKHTALPPGAKFTDVLRAGVKRGNGKQEEGEE